MHFVHVNLELQSRVSELVPQTNYSKLWSWTLLHIQKLFFTNLLGVHAYKFIFELTIFLLSGQNFVYAWFHSAIYQSKAAEVENFFCGCYQALSSQCFWGEGLGMRLLSKGGLIAWYTLDPTHKFMLHHQTNKNKRLPLACNVVIKVGSWNQNWFLFSFSLSRNLTS